MNNSATLKDIMIDKDLIVIKLNTPFHKIKTIFDENNFHHLPVVDDMAMVKGIISKSDFTKITYPLTTNTSGKIYSQKFYNSLTAKDIMTNNPIYLNPDDRIGLAADLFLENQYHALPIVEDGVLVGIVTSHDLLVYAYYKPPVGGQ